MLDHLCKSKQSYNQNISRNRISSQPNYKKNEHDDKLGQSSEQFEHYSQFPKSDERVELPILQDLPNISQKSDSLHVRGNKNTA